MPASLAGRLLRAACGMPLGALLALCLSVTSDVHAQQTAAPTADTPTTAGGPVRLRQPTQALPDTTRPAAETRLPPAYVPGEFERFVQRQSPQVEVRRFGADLVTRASEGAMLDATPIVPPDYPVAPGDEVLVTIWGSVDADLRLIVDRSGRINIPRVGAIQVAGVRQADLADAIGRRVGQIFKNYQLSVSLGALRGIRVFVTGFVASPGAYQVTSLSTLTSALLRAGGPTPGGSYRRIELRRAGQTVTSFDLYDFMLNGDRAADRLLQAGDVIHVLPVGTEIAMIGSVNRPAVLELKTGETVADVLRMAGGLSAVADRTRIAIERLADRNAVRIRELSLPADLNATVERGDLLRAFSAVDAVLPVQRQNKRVRIEGEVLRPGDFVLPPESTLVDALTAAGGLTPAAFVYGTTFARESVRLTQQENYERALRDLETDFARQGTQRTTTTDEAASSTARAAATSRLVERLRAVKPTGRIVLQLPSDARQLPALALEDGDRILIPPRPTTVGVFGSVFNAGSYLFNGSRTVDDYLRLAGGPTAGSDESSIFVVRANGSVVSGRQGGVTWLGGRSNSNLLSLPAEPGDTLFVPEEVNKTTFVQSAKDWTQILYQLGIGIAGLVSATK